MNKYDNSNVGKVYLAETKFIDKDTKKHRRYVVVEEKNNKIGVSKLKSIKYLDENNRNADKALVEINQERYNLPKRTGVDYQIFRRNRIKKTPLSLSDRDVFSEKPLFTLGSRDLSRVKRHTKLIKNKKKR